MAILDSIVVIGLRKFLKYEMKSLCSGPYLLNKARESLSTFSWETVYDILKAKAPTILAFLEACLSSLDGKVAVGVCASILAKARCPSVSLLQHIISIILYSGHSGKKVKILSRPLQPLLVIVHCAECLEKSFHQTLTKGHRSTGPREPSQLPPHALGRSTPQ